MDAPNEIERQLRGMLLDSVRLQLAAGANHLDGIGALLRPAGPSNAFFVVVRSVLDALGPAWWILSPGTQLVVPGGATCTAPDDPAATMRTTAARLLCYLAADARQYRDVLIALHGSIIDPDLQGRFDRYEQFATLVAPNAIRRSPTHHDWTIDGQTRRSRCRGTARRQPRPNTTGSPGTGARMISTSRSSESRATRDPVCVGRLHRIRASAIEQFIESGTVEVSPPRMRPSFGRW